MSGRRNYAIAFALLVSTTTFCAVGFARIGAVNADSCFIQEPGSGPRIDLALAGVPCPFLEDGLARSATDYFYCTNNGPDSTIYKIDIATGTLVETASYFGADFQGLAYVDSAFPEQGGVDLLYGLDSRGNQLVEFYAYPVLTPTGVTIPIVPGTGKRACAGGNNRVFVQQYSSGGLYSIWRYELSSGAWISLAPSPLAGTVVLDGLSAAGRMLTGTELVTGGSNIWRRSVHGTWRHLGGPPTVPTFPDDRSALGAF